MYHIHEIMNLRSLQDMMLLKTVLAKRTKQKNNYGLNDLNQHTNK